MKVQVELGSMILTPPAIRRYRHKGAVLPRDIEWSAPEELELGEDGILLSLPPSGAPRFVRVTVPGEAPRVFDA